MEKRNDTKVVKTAKSNTKKTVTKTNAVVKTSKTQNQVDVNALQKDLAKYTGKKAKKTRKSVPTAVINGFGNYHGTFHVYGDGARAIVYKQQSRGTEFVARVVSGETEFANEAAKKAHMETGLLYAGMVCDMLIRLADQEQNVTMTVGLNELANAFNEWNERAPRPLVRYINEMVHRTKVQDAHINKLSGMLKDKRFEKWSAEC